MKTELHNNRKSKIGIKWKLFAYLSVFTVIILIILWLCQVVFLGDIYRGIKTSEIHSASDKLSKSVYDQAELQSIADSVSSKYDMCVLAVKIKGDDSALIIASSDVLSSCAIHNMTRDGVFILYNAAASNDGSYLQHYRFDSIKGEFDPVDSYGESGEEESIVYSFIRTDNQGNKILFILNSIVSPVEATVRTLNILLVVISAVMLLLALLLAFFISKKISKPIEKINDCAKSLAYGNYSATFNIGSFKEISELNQTLNFAASELSKVDALRRELIANTSHDLRTPLTMITGYAEIMRDLPDENTPENAQVIIDESKRLTTLVNDMLDMSKLESGNQNISPEAFDLTDTVRRGMDRYNQLCEREGYKIIFKHNINVKVYADRSKLLQAFYNIVNNALTYTGSDKTVIIEQIVYKDSMSHLPMVRLAISDSGEGIPPDQLELIWDRYYKADSAHKRASIGSGLGLSIVKKIMDLIGGRCGVSSGVGIGSTFWIEIPYLPDAD